MAKSPTFPEFKEFELADKDAFDRFFREYQPETSELTFSNLFIWREHYQMRWSVYRDWLLVFCTEGKAVCQALPPTGPSPRVEVTRLLLRFLEEKRANGRPAIERADKRLVDELAQAGGFSSEPTRDHFDYLYRTQDLIELSGKKYHGKRNHIAQFKKAHSFAYRPLGREHISQCLELAEEWCVAHRCEEDLGLSGEKGAVKEALRCFDELGLEGGVLIVDGKLRAFTLGEKLNQKTAVVHIEKADPSVEGLYPMINQQFCEHAFFDFSFVNREQDLGEPGLRKAKLSYHPTRMVEKFKVHLT
jgi:uncharacterized protein